MKKLDTVKIKHLLDEKGLTQAKVADKIGIEPSAVSCWINGKTIPSSENLSKLAQLVGKEPDELTLNDPTNQMSPNNAYGNTETTVNHNPNITHITIHKVDINNLNLITPEDSDSLASILESIIKPSDSKEENNSK